MEFLDVLNSLKSLGPPGLLLSYMIWDRITQTVVNKDRTKADILMATALTELTAEIRRGRN